MTVKTLLNIILKVFGLVFVKDVLAGAPALLSVFLLPGGDDHVLQITGVVVFGLVVIAFNVLVVYYLIFRSQILIEKLRLDRGFDQEVIPLDIHRSTILSISIIVIGGLIVADGIPNLGWQLFTLFENRNALKLFEKQPATAYAVYAAVKLIVGLLLIGHQRDIVRFIEWKRQK